MRKTERSFKNIDVLNAVCVSDFLDQGQSCILVILEELYVQRQVDI